MLDFFIKNKLYGFKVSKFSFKFLKFDLIAIFMLLFFFMYLQFSVITPLQSLPSPMYGGDYYYQMGCVNHMKYGGDITSNCNLMSDVPGYSPFYPIVVGGVSNVLNVDAFTAEMLMSYVFVILSILISYILFRKFTDNPLLASFGVMLFVNIIAPVIKYAQLGKYIMIPLTIYAIYLFYLKQSYSRIIFLAVVLGLTSITHTTIFVPGFLLVGLVFLYILNDNKINNFKFTSQRFSHYIINSSFKVLSTKSCFTRFEVLILAN